VLACQTSGFHPQSGCATRVWSGAAITGNSPGWRANGTTGVNGTRPSGAKVARKCRRRKSVRLLRRLRCWPARC
jgi:hypothetical protein